MVDEQLLFELLNLASHLELDLQDIIEPQYERQASCENVFVKS